MTANQMVKLFAKVLKDAPSVNLSEKTLKQIKEIGDTVKNASTKL